MAGKVYKAPNGNVYSAPTGEARTFSCAAPPCCASDEFFLRFNICGSNAPTTLWVLSTILNPESSVILYDDKCYCFSGEIKRRSQLPFGATLVEEGSLPSYDTCCPCLSATYEGGCIYDVLSGCCCSLPPPGLQPSFFVSGSWYNESTQFHESGPYTITRSGTMTDNHYSLTFTGTGYDPHYEEGDLSQTNGRIPPCNPEGMRNFAIVIAEEFPFYVPENDGEEGITSSDCNSVTYNFYKLYDIIDSPGDIAPGYYMVSASLTIRFVQTNTCGGCAPLDGNPEYLDLGDPP